MHGIGQSFQALFPVSYHDLDLWAVIVGIRMAVLLVPVTLAVLLLAMAFRLARHWFPDLKYVPSSVCGRELPTQSNTTRGLLIFFSAACLSVSIRFVLPLGMLYACVPLQLTVVTFGLACFFLITLISLGTGGASDGPVLKMRVTCLGRWRHFFPLFGCRMAGVACQSYGGSDGSSHQ